MSSRQINYLAAAIAWRFNSIPKQEADDLGTSISNFKLKFENIFHLKLNEELFDRAFDELSARGFVDIIRDDYAGNMVFYSATVWNDKYEDFVDAGNRFYFKDTDAELGFEFFERVFKNPKFWEDLKLGQDMPSLAVPASDRVVHLSDNYREEIDGLSAELIRHVQQENAIDGDVELRDRFIAQISAGRELVRAASVRVYLLYETLVRTLLTLIEKYKATALGELAKKLLDVLVDHVLGK